MKRNAQVWMFLALTPLAISLTGCGSSSVDSRDIEFNGGLAFQVNHQDPFTGVVMFVHDVPGIVEKLYGHVPMAAYSVEEYQSVQRLTCDFHYVKGVMNGDAKCKNDNGDKVATFSVNENGLFDGSAVLYSTWNATKKYAELNWKSGALDGDQNIYGDDGSVVIDEVHFSDGQKDGREVVRDEAGDVIANGKWDNGKPESGSLADAQIVIGQNGAQNLKVKEIVNFADGLQNGKATFYAYGNNGYFKSPKDLSSSSGEFDNGKRTGLWTDDNSREMSFNSIRVMIDQAFHAYPEVLSDFPPYSTGSGGARQRYDALDKCNTYASHWSQGQLGGKVECFDKSGKPNVEFEIENGQLVGDVLFHDPSSGQVVTIHQQGGRAVPESGMASTSKAAPQAAFQAASGSIACVNQWINAFHKEQGADASISNDQLSEWQDDCQQGKQAPQ